MPLPRPHLLLDLFLNSLYSISRNAGMVELVDAADSKSAARKSLWVQVPLPVPAKSSGYGKTWPLFVSLMYTCPEEYKKSPPSWSYAGGQSKLLLEQSMLLGIRCSQASDGLLLYLSCCEHLRGAFLECLHFGRYVCCMTIQACSSFHQKVTSPSISLGLHGQHTQRTAGDRESEAGGRSPLSLRLGSG